MLCLCNTGCLDDSGCVYTWGYGSLLALGLPRERFVKQDQAVPQQVRGVWCQQPLSGPQTCNCCVSAPCLTGQGCSLKAAWGVSCLSGNRRRQ